MYIMNNSENMIIDSHYVERFCLAKKEDAVLIVASYGDNRAPVTVGRYKDEKEAKEELNRLFVALSEADDVSRYYMPLGRYYAEQVWIRDARTKRRGGS